MASYNWQVYRHNGTSWVQLTNVQSLAYRYGQHQLTDTWSPPVWTITGRVPADLGSIKIGDWIAVINSGSPEFIYQVTNYEVFYGIKSSMDTWTMQIESVFSALARSVISTTFPDDGTTGYADMGQAFSNVRSAAAISATILVDAAISQQTITNENGLDVFTRLARTSSRNRIAGNTGDFPYVTCYPIDAGSATSQQKVSIEKGVPATTASYTFTDATPAAGEAIYDGLTFGSLNLNYANKVVLTPIGAAVVTVGSGNSAFETSTYSATSSYATQTANRYLGLLSASQSVPLSITYTREQQPSGVSLPNQLAVLNTGAFIKVVFRGSNYYATVLGQELTSTPGSTRVTLYLCASDSFNFFTLNSAILGVLDTNRLGF